MFVVAVVFVLQLASCKINRRIDSDCHAVLYVRRYLYGL